MASNSDQRAGNSNLRAIARMVGIAAICMLVVVVLEIIFFDDKLQTRGFVINQAIFVAILFATAAALSYRGKSRKQPDAQEDSVTKGISLGYADLLCTLGYFLLLLAVASLSSYLSATADQRSSFLALGFQLLCFLLPAIGCLGQAFAMFRSFDG